jgi:hypothetical protein
VLFLSSLVDLIVNVNVDFDGDGDLNVAARTVTLKRSDSEILVNNIATTPSSRRMPRA